MSDRVIVDISDGIADVRLNRPNKRNALDGDMFEALNAMGERLRSEPEVRAVVLSGEGKSFCAGLDLDVRSRSSANVTDGSIPGRCSPAG